MDRQSLLCGEKFVSLLYDPVTVYKYSTAWWNE